MTSVSSPAPLVLGIGGAHLDRRGQVAGIYVPGTSNPGIMREDVGGVVFNALRTARRRNVRCALISLRGGDPGGERVAREVEAAGIEDRSAVFLDRATASYTALIDRDGDLIAGFADMGLYDLFPRLLRRSACREAIAGADAVLCDANLPQPALERVAALAGDTPFHAIGISPAKVVRLAGLLDRIACLFMNRKEALALAGLEPGSSVDPIAVLRARGLAGAVITDGAAPVTLCDAAGRFEIVPPAPRQVVDVTGAGDALAGATVAALARGVPLAQAAREGLAAAMLALETPLAVPSFDSSGFAAALALVPGAVRMA